MTPKQHADHLRKLAQQWERKRFEATADSSFALANDPPAPPKGPPIFGNKATQKALFTGCDCEPGQLDLFSTDAVVE